MKKTKYRILEHTTSKGVYYTLQYRGLLWGWNTLKEHLGEDVCFKSVEDIHNYLDSLKDIVRIIEEF